MTPSRLFGSLIRNVRGKPNLQHSRNNTRTITDPEKAQHNMLRKSMKCCKDEETWRKPRPVKLKCRKCRTVTSEPARQDKLWPREFLSNCQSEVSFQT